MSEEKIASVLGLKPLEEALKETPKNEIAVRPVDGEIVSTTNQPEVDDETIRDIDTAKQNIENIIRQGDESLTEIISIAKQSQSARAFEVVSNLMKTLLDANKDFVEMSTKKKYAVDELNAPKEAAQTNVTNNNLIISTADLLKMIKGDKTQ